MKKNILWSFFSLLFFMLISCEDNKKQFLDEFETVLYFRNSGELPVATYLTGDNVTYDLVVNKAGTNTSSIASVEIASMDEEELNAYNTIYKTNYKVLPKDCYCFDLTQLTFSSTESYKSVTISLNTKKIKEVRDTDDSNYVIAMQLFNGSDSINENKKYAFIIPTVEIPTIGFEKYGYVAMSLPDDGEIKDTLSVNVAIPIEDAWNLQCKVEVDFAALEKYNKDNDSNFKLLPEKCYQLPNSVMFEKKQKQAPFNVIIHKSEIEYGSFILPLSISNVSKDEFVIDENKKTILMGISFTLPDISLTADMLSTNALEPTEGSLANLLDGDISTYFHSSWSVQVEEQHHVQVALNKPIHEFIFSYTTRENNGDAAPAEFYVSVSSDGKCFKEVHRFSTAKDNLPTTGAMSWKSPTIEVPDIDVNYIRFVNVINTKGYDNFVWSEFSLFGK